MDNLPEIPNVPATSAAHFLEVPQPSATPFPHKDKPPARLGLLAGTSRPWIHAPQRGKPLASRIGLASQGADGCRYRSIRENGPVTQDF